MPIRYAIMPKSNFEKYIVFKTASSYLLLAENFYY